MTNATTWACSIPDCPGRGSCPQRADHKKSQSANQQPCPCVCPEPWVLHREEAWSPTSLTRSPCHTCGEAAEIPAGPVKSVLYHLLLTFWEVGTAHPQCCPLRRTKNPKMGSCLCAPQLSHPLGSHLRASGGVGSFQSSLPTGEATSK